MTLWSFLLQISLWLLAIGLTVIVVAALVNALDERQQDRAAIDPDLLRSIQHKNRLIALRRSAESRKSEPPHVA